MEHIREYLLSVTSAAILCGILQAMAGQKSGAAGILRLVCGIFLTFTVIGPFTRISLQDIAWVTSDVLSDADRAVVEGKDYAQRAMERHIKEEAQAYILDKARSYDARITVEVRVSEEDPPVPNGCTVTGELSSYARKQLSAVIQEDLGIPKEDQIWISSSSTS